MMALYQECERRIMVVFLSFSIRTLRRIMWVCGPSRTGTAQWRKLKAWAKRNLPYCCALCGSAEALQLDHIVPVAEGGSDSMDNVQWLCVQCHGVKSDAEARRGMVRRMNKRRRPDRYRGSHPGLA